MEKTIISLNHVEQKILRYMYVKYLKDKNIPYQEYKKKIFKIERPRIINQMELLKQELKEIKEADKIYNKSIKDITSNIIEYTEYGLPSKFRCNYIMNKKNNLTRCKKIIIDGDCIKYECCLRHNKLENIYYDKYVELCKKIDIS